MGPNRSRTGVHKEIKKSKGKKNPAEIGIILVSNQRSEPKYHLYSYSVFKPLFTHQLCLIPSLAGEASD